MGQGIEIGPHATVESSGLVARRVNGKKRYIFDREYRDLLKEHLVDANTNSRKYGSLHSHMGQCFAGGFIDELADEATISHMSFDTHAAWSGLTRNVGSSKPPGPRLYYGYEWRQQIEMGRNVREAYTNALTGDDFPRNIRNSQRPQYFSDPNGADNTKLAADPTKTTALLFVGSDRIRGARKTSLYRDARRFYKTLRDDGVPAENIRIFFDNGKPPRKRFGELPLYAQGLADDKFRLPINGTGSEVNFNSFFDAPPIAVDGQDEQVLVWTAGHGTLGTRKTGKTRVVPASSPLSPAGYGGGSLGGFAEFDVQMDQLYFDEVLSNPFSVDNPELVFHFVPTEDIRVYLDNSYLNTIKPTDGVDAQIEIDRNLLKLSGNRLRFETVGTEVDIDDFGIYFAASDVQTDLLIVDTDTFDDGSPSANTSGEGRGYLDFGQGAGSVAELDGALSLNVAGPGVAAVAGNSLFNFMSPEESTVIFDIEGLDIGTASDQQAAFVGLGSSADVVGTSFGLPNDTEGPSVFVQLMDSANTYGAGTEGAILIDQEGSTDPIVLASWSWSSFDGSLPLEIAMYLDENGWELAFDDGTEGVFGDWLNIFDTDDWSEGARVFANYQSMSASGALDIGQVRIFGIVPEPTTAAILMVGCLALTNTYRTRRSVISAP